MHKGLGDEIMVAPEEGDAIQRAAREVVGDFSPEFPAQHRVDVVMGGVWEVGHRGHAEVPLAMREMGEVGRVWADILSVHRKCRYGHIWSELLLFLFFKISSMLYNSQTTYVG